MYYYFKVIDNLRERTMLLLFVCVCVCLQNKVSTVTMFQKPNIKTSKNT